MLHSVTIYQSIWQNNPEDFNPTQDSREGLDSYLGFISQRHSDNTPLNGKVWEEVVVVLFAVLFRY